MYKKYIGVILLSGLTTISVYSQESGVQLIRLSDAISLGLKNNLEIQIAKNDVEAATLLNHYGVAGGLPTVVATASNTEQINNINQRLSNGTVIERKGAAGNNTAVSLSGGIVLYNGKRIVATKNRLEQIQQQSKEVLNGEIQNLISQISNTYYDIVRQQSYVKTIDQSILASEKRLEILEARRSAGLANNADMFQAQIDLNALIQNRKSQDLVVGVAKTELLRLLNIDLQQNIAVDDTIVVDKQVELTDILDQIRTNPDLKAADQQIRIQELIVHEVKAQRYPTLRLNLGYNYSRNQSAAGFNLLNQSNGPNANLSLNIPIYNGSALKRQQHVAEIDVTNSRIQYQSLERDYSSQAVKTYQSYRNALEQLALETKNYEISRQLLDLTLQRFELIQATIIDLREAQKSFEEAGYRLVNLSFAAKVAEIEMKRMVGLLE